MNEALQSLRGLQKKLYALNYSGAVIGYDDATVAPPDSWPGRGEAVSVLSGMLYELLASPRTAELLDEARRGPLSEVEAAELDELQRQCDEVCKIPAEEYAAFAKLANDSQNAWVKAKRANDFGAFAPYLEQVVAYCRRAAGYLAPDKAPYDVWLDRYERGLTMQQADQFFDALQTALVPLVAKVVKAKPPRTDFLSQNWPLEQQRQLSDHLMQLMTVDRGHCTIGESEHPFTSEFYRGDVRITTHYHPGDMASSLFSVVHESGHALYELHIGEELAYTCLSGGASMGLHESQSRLFENYIGRSEGFIHALWPKLNELFCAQLAGVSEQELYRAVNYVQPSLIRTEADELTYCLHILVRYRLEKQLINGSLAVKDLPDAWNREMREVLGVEVPDDAHGCLQDIHWSMGELGYFPSYALGTAYAAQIMAAMRRELDVDRLTQQGELAPIVAWLADHIWKYGKSKSPRWLLENACGAPFDPQYFIDYLTEKYTKLYNL